MHTVFALLCFVVVKHWMIFPYPSGLLHWHCGNLTIAPVPAKQPWWIWINTSCEFIMNNCITTTKQSTTKQCAYFLGYTVAVATSLYNFNIIYMYVFTHNYNNNFATSIIKSQRIIDFTQSAIAFENNVLNSLWTLSKQGPWDTLKKNPKNKSKLFQKWNIYFDRIPNKTLNQQHILHALIQFVFYNDLIR